MRGPETAQDCIQARGAVIESACSINVVVEWTCHRCQFRLYRDGTEKLSESISICFSVMVKDHIITSVDLITALEEMGGRGWGRKRRGL